MLTALSNGSGSVSRDVLHNASRVPRVAAGVSLPLTMSRIPSEILLSHARGSNYSQEDQQMLLAIHHNLGRAESFLKEIHVAGDSVQMQYAPLHLPSFTAEILDAFNPMAKSRNIQFCYTLDFEPHTEYVPIDRLRLEKIVLNLLINASFSTPKGGSISLNLQTRQLQRGQINLLCKVSDSGLAIATSNLLRPENWGYRVVQSQQSGSAGASLRLAIEITDSIGGSLNIVQPDSSYGAAFTLSLHCAKTDLNKLPNLTMPDYDEFHIPLPSEPVGTLHIVEADYEMGEWLKVCLKGYFNIHTYPSASIFFQFAAQNAAKEQIEIDVILFNLLLPDADGFELLHTIRGNAILQNVPVIAFSTNPHPNIRDKALYNGVDDYLAIPFSVNELRLRILNILRRTKWYSKEVTTSYPFVPEMSVPFSQKFLQTIPDNKKPWMSQLLRLIEDNLQNEQLNIPLLAKNMAVSKRQLFRIIKESTGLSPNQLIQEIRLNNALQLLENQFDMSVSEVAYAVGMSNPGYFATAFKKRFQKNPSSYRSSANN